MYNVMVDLETLSDKANAVVVAIGAVKFDPEAGTLGQEFYAKLDLEYMLHSSSVKNEFDISAGTIKWWMKQSDEARKAFDGTARVDEVLQEFGLYCLGILEREKSFSEIRELTKNVKMWGNGADFDNVILKHLYDVSGHLAPWKFWNNRCYRTMKALMPNVKMERVGTHHNALDDAKSQAEHLIRIFKALRDPDYVELGIKSA